MRNVYIVFLASNDLGFRRLIMPLGPLAVAVAVRRSASFKSDDLLFICDTFREVLHKAERHKNDRVFFLASSMQLIRGVNQETNPAILYGKTLKSRFPNVISCVGGPDVSLNHDDYLAHFDLVFQGEIGTTDLLDLIGSGVRSFNSPAPADMNAEVFDYELLRGKKYLAGTLQTTRGCPFDCSFCNIGHIYGRGVRTIDPDLLERRLESLATIHRGFVIFGDDNFGGGIEDKILEFLDVIIRFQERRRYPFVFGIQVSLNVARYPEVMKKLREANVTAAFVGVESPSEEALAASRKRQNLWGPMPEQVETFVRHGIVPYLSFILGLDREPEDVGRRLRDLLDICQTPFLMLNLINPVIGSRFRAKAAAAGRLLDHPLYFRYNLMPLKTGRPYAKIVEDYGALLAWFYDSRRLLRYCGNLERKRKDARDPRIQRLFMAHVSWFLILKLFGFYAGICLKSGALTGLFKTIKLIGRPKAEVLDFLLIRGTALGSKRSMAQAVRKVRAGLDGLRKSALYPYDIPGDSRRTLSSGATARPIDKRSCSRAGMGTSQ